jgi:hypothetical protein
MRGNTQNTGLTFLFGFRRTTDEGEHSVIHVDVFHGATVGGGGEFVGPLEKCVVR